MKVKTGAILTAGVIFLAVLLGYLLYTSFQPVSELAQFSPVEEDGGPEPAGMSPPALRLEEAEITLVDQDNRICWQLRIRTMEKNGHDFALEEVGGEYFTPAGEVFAVQAKKGTVSDDFSRLFLQEVAITGEELTVNAGKMEWTAARGGMLSGEEIILKKQGIEVLAGRIRVDPGLEKVVVDGPSRWKFPAGQQVGGG